MRSRSRFPDAIEGRTVVLRPHAAHNVAAFKRWYADPEVARLTRYQDGPMHPDEVGRFFEARVAGAGSLALAIHLRETDRLIGTCAFSQLDGDNGSALFHITIGERDCWDRGYGTEATALMLDHAFGTLGLHRVGLAVFAFNERAIRSYQKVGFVVEGRSREAIWRDGLFSDEIHMSILADEWQAARSRVSGLEPEAGRSAGAGAGAGPGATAGTDAGAGTGAGPEGSTGAGPGATATATATAGAGAGAGAGAQAREAAR